MKRSALTLLADLRPLRHSTAFRRLWISSTLATWSEHLASFAVLYYVWEITNDAILVGAVSLVVAVPMLAFTFVGGSLADTTDRRRLAVLTTLGQLVLSVSLVGLLLVDTVTVPVLFALVAARSAMSAVGAPARRAFIPRLLPSDQLSAGLALTHLAAQTSLLAGPALAGAITTLWGVSACFAIQALLVAAALWGVLGLPPMRPEAVRSRFGLRGVWRGIRFVSRSHALGGALLCDLGATALAMPVALFPVLNTERFDGSPATLGLLFTAMGAGGLITSALSGSITRLRHPGRILLAAATVWGGALAGVGLADNFPVACLLLTVAGGADAITVITRGTIVQRVTPDSHRGRISAMEHLIGSAAPHVGNFRAGLVADTFSGGTAFLIGGLTCVASVVLLAGLVSPLRQLDIADEPSPHKPQRH